MIPLLLALASPPAPPTILATCGASTGKGYFVLDGKGVWADDGITKGRLVFSVADDDKPNLSYYDTFSGTVDAVADGGRVFLTNLDETGDFSMVVIYPATAVAETYSLIRLATGKRQLVWTTNKAHTGVGQRASSAKVFTADCD